MYLSGRLLFAFYSFIIQCYTFVDDNKKRFPVFAGNGVIACYSCLDDKNGKSSPVGRKYSVNRLHKDDRIKYVGACPYPRSEHFK